MEPFIWIGILVCISHSAMFSGLNLAVFSLSRLQLEVEAADGDTATKRVLDLRSDPQANIGFRQTLGGHCGRRGTATSRRPRLRAGPTAGTRDNTAAWVAVPIIGGLCFFSSSETALFSLSRLELNELRSRHHPRADTLHALLDQPRRLIISILCGNEIINVAAAANMTAILLQLYSEEQVVLLNILIMVPLLLLFGEVTPKTIAVTNPLQLSTRLIVAPMALWLRLVTPFRWLVRLVSERVTTLLVGPEKAPENILQIDEFRTLLEEVVASGELHATERILIDNLLAAGSTEVVEIMIPRTQVAFLPVELSVPEMVEKVRQFQHRRIPVYRKFRDTLVGMLHAEDLMQMALDDTDFSTIQREDILRPVIMVPPTKKVDEMFGFFLQHDAQAAMVLNEFGGIDGLVTLKDLVNFIFGHASTEKILRKLFSEPEQGVFEVDGAMKLADFDNVTNFGLSDSRMTTVGGVVLRHLDRLPAIGDEVTVEKGWRLVVIALEGHRIARLRALPEALQTAEPLTEAVQSTTDENEKQATKNDAPPAHKENP